MTEFARLLERDMQSIRSPEFGVVDVQRRQARRQRDQRLIAGGVGLAIAIALVAAIVVASRTDHMPAKQPTPRGIFTGAAGSIVFGSQDPHQDGVWALDPDVPSAPTHLAEP